MDELALLILLEVTWMLNPYRSRTNIATDAILTINRRHMIEQAGYKLRGDVAAFR
jgi:hypothetical protein